MEIKKHPTFKKEYVKNNSNFWAVFWAIIAIVGFFYPFKNSNYGLFLSILGVSFSLIAQFKKSKNLTSACCPSCNSVIKTSWRDTNYQQNHMIKCVRCNIVWDLGIKKTNHDEDIFHYDN